MKRTINAVVQIEYHTENYDYCTEEENDITALDLAINPNFHTVENGVSLKSVHLEQVEPYKLVDFDKLKHNPDFVCIEP